MLKSYTICASLLLLILSLTNAQAQGDIAKSATPEALIITAAASDERVRFTAPASVVQIRLEVYASTGKKLFDNELRGGNVLDWHLQNGQAEPLADDTYLCVVTVKNLSGRITQRIGSVRVEKSAASLQPAGASQMTAQQSDAIGPVEENAPLTILNDGETQTATVIAHDGTDGQLIRGRGALSFRLGDFFAGTDKEQMRLTAEGNLGIGTSDPKVKLDVAGMIGAREGVMFSDGSTLNVNRKGVLTHNSAGGDVSISAAGTGTLNRLAKWTETGGAGGLGDSLLDEAGGGVELRPASAGVGINPVFINPSAVAGFSQLQAYPVSGPNTNSSLAVVPRGTGIANNRAQLAVLNTDVIADSNNYEFASLRARGTDFVFGTGKAGTGVNRPFMFAAGFLSDNTTNNGQLFLATDGNVGIGTTGPLYPLTVSGAAGAGQNQGVAEFTNAAADAGVRIKNTAAGGRTYTLFSSGTGSGIGVGNFNIFDATANASRLSINSSGNVGIGTPAPLAKLDVRGDVFVGLPSVPVDVSTTQNALYVANDSGDSRNHFRIDGFGNNLAIVAHSGTGSPAGASISLRTAPAGGGDIDRVTIDPSGKVSIGATTSPGGATLYVESTARAVQGNSTGTSGSAAIFQITNASNVFQALFASSLGTGPAVVGTGFGNGNGVDGAAIGNGDAVNGTCFDNCGGIGFAGNFTGDVNVTGAIFAGTKDFKIDHPLDPANKYLVHASIESSESKNLYDGVVVLDPSGEAIVVLPDWFESLNRDFRYQLTCIGGSAQVYVAEEIANHRFKIAGGRQGMKVSWQVTGNRQDPFIKAHPMVVEEAKREIERGFYIHPELYGQPEEMGMQWARRPEQMRQMKEQREKRSLPKQ